MNVNPFVERLREHASRVGALPGTELAPQRAAPAERGEPVDQRAAPAERGEPVNDRAVAPSPLVNRGQVAFWQSPIARAFINRRITGDPELGPETHFARRYGPQIVAPCGLSLRASDAKFEIALVEAGSCQRLIGLDEEQSRVDFASGRVPEPLRARVRFQLGTVDRYQATEPIGAVVCRSFLHRRDDLEQMLDRLAGILAPGGLLFVEDFVGPSRFQWTDLQLEVINRLLAQLPTELLTDLTATDGRRKRSVERPDPAAWASANPHEAVRSEEILPALDARFERIEVCPCGGAVFHQLFSRIIGNFAGRPELVGLLMEVDALLTDHGLLASDYVWGVWRRP
jgi:SAM-dependent methyltransferase